jgi:hypothetical protein
MLADEYDQVAQLKLPGYEAMHTMVTACLQAYLSERAENGYKMFCNTTNLSVALNQIDKLNVKTKSVTGTLLRPIKLNQRSPKTLVLSSRQLGWNGILVEQYHYSPTPSEVERPARSDHCSSYPFLGDSY